jgi:DNA sulfur modification protein DndD
MGYRGHELVLEEFSAGERQLYNLAVFKALREISGLDLPLFVDTPFARLDATHRQRLVGGFLQSFANQLVLFITDAEGQALGSTNELHLEQDAYWLEADPTQQATAVSVLDLGELIRRARDTVAT